MEETLQRALDRIFIEGTGKLGPGVATPEGQVRPVPETPTAVPEVRPTVVEPAGGESLDMLAALAQEHYTRAMQAQRDGNWALYGEEIKKLGEILQKMRKGR